MPERLSTRVLREIRFWTILYPYGFLLFLVVGLLYCVGTIQTRGWGKFIHNARPGMLMVSNHPSLFDPFVLPGLFALLYLLHPKQYGPWSTPDKKNYFDRFPISLLQDRMIAVPRKDKNGKIRAFRTMLRVLKNGMCIIVFGEGGRTFKGKPDEFVYSPKKKKRMRKLLSSIGLLARNSGSIIVPVWVEGSDKTLPNGMSGIKVGIFNPFRRTKIMIGDPIKPLPGESQEEIQKRVQEKILELADAA